MTDLDALQGRLGYRFRDPAHLETAITHRSYAAERTAAADPRAYNERLEFLGDAVVDLAVSHWLLEQLPDAPEGRLSVLRAAVVNERSLAAAARAVGLGEALRLGRGEERTGGREKVSILADAYEALLGAVFLDGGWPAAAPLVRAHLASALADAEAGRVAPDHKTRLQEVVHQQGGAPPAYVLVSASGPDHAPTFEVEVSVAGRILGRGQGPSKKEAEQRAAAAALATLAGGEA